MINTLLAVALAATVVAAPSSATDVASVARPASVQTEPFGEIVNRMLLALREERAEDALALAKSLAAHSDFAGQPLAVRRGVWHVIGALNVDLGRYEAALEPLRTAARMPGADADVWFTLINAEARAGRRDAAALSVIEMVRLIPSALDSVSDSFVYQLARDEDVSADVRFALREALWEAGWAPDGASGFWLAYIDGLLERGRMDRAQEVLPRVTSPSSRLQLHASHRYAELRARAGDPPFDIESAFAADLAADRAAAEAPDVDLEDRSTLASSLMMAGRYEEALAVADAALALPRPTKDSDDWGVYTWIMDTRSRVLMMLGRPDEAVAQMQAAARRVEGEDVNVSQTINLGWLYLRVGRNAEALAAVADVSADDASPFGVMQATEVTACAAYALGDMTTATKAHAYLVEHWRDAPLALQESLACRGDADGMAALLIRRLEDPELADAALAELHDYLPTPNPTAFDARMIALNETVAARPDVVAARDRVGRVLTVPSLPGLF